ncbi:dienelactone hydrolase family protein [Robbsia sp. KACC 23696]|uniref:dienelactone hydrolase family protein n=1 Tax=Robbsia sp. KACC 23696 TaxID=3149231 RepID=UPI00325B3F31
MASEYITIPSKDGGHFRAYLALPPRGTGPGLVLCHEIFGANGTMRELANIYAEEGYVVAVPDLYWREEAALEFDYTSGDWQRAYRLSQAYDFDLGVDDIAATLEALRGRPEVRDETTASVAARRDRSDRSERSDAPTEAPRESGRGLLSAGAALWRGRRGTAAASLDKDARHDTAPVGPNKGEAPGGLSVVGYSLGGRLAYLAACRLEGVGCGVSYYGTGIEEHLDEADKASGRLVLHLPDNDKFVTDTDRDAIAAHFAASRNVEVYVYPRAERGFARRGTDSYNRPAATIAHQRTMGALKREMGPYFDLSLLWDTHVRQTMDEKDVDAIMEGLVDAPYLNHVPTRTGGAGREGVAAFYRDHFVGQMPADTRMLPLSRTVGATQLVEEALLSLTHSNVIDWLLPGVAPTQRYIEVPLVCVVTFRGEKIHRLQTYWDQASVLVQIGRMAADAQPVAGIECARKIVNEDLPSNELIDRTPS